MQPHSLSKGTLQLLHLRNSQQFAPCLERAATFLETRRDRSLDYATLIIDESQCYHVSSATDVARVLKPIGIGMQHTVSWRALA